MGKEGGLTGRWLTNNSYYNTTITNSSYITFSIPSFSHEYETVTAASTTNAIHAISILQVRKN
jgi:hypothetical protein